MIRFMVIAAPRSGTAWAANWLTTDRTLCLHDPLWRRHYADLDTIASPKTLGVACTGLQHFSKWTNAHRARKVVLRRDLGEINRSLKEIGMPALEPDVHRRIEAVDGLHVPWTDIFDNPVPIWEHLLPGIPFDAERHAALRELEVQTHFEGITVDRKVTARLIAEMQAATMERFQ